jgi:hypothetical protein
MANSTTLPPRRADGTFRRDYSKILWAITGIVVPILIGAAISLVGLTPGEFLAARAAFIVAAIMPAAVCGYWLYMSRHPRPWKWLVGVAVAGYCLVGLLASQLWVSYRERLAGTVPLSASRASEPTAPAALPQPPVVHQYVKPFQGGDKEPTYIEPPQAMRSNPDKSPKVFVRIDILKAQTDLQNLTEDQFSSIYAPYIGKWVAMSGFVANISSYTQTITVALVSDRLLSVNALFDKKWTYNLNILKKGDAIAFVCNIDRLGINGLWLNSCQPIVQ